MPNIYNEETAFHSWKKCSFLLGDIGIFIDFLVLEKKKTKIWSFGSCRSSIFKRDQEKPPEKFDCLVHQIKKCKKRKTLLECVVSTSTAKHILKSVLVKKGKLKPDVNIISDLIRDEKYVDNNIHIFHLLWGLIWKILIGKYCEDSAWAECLKFYDKKKSSKWFCLVCQKIIAMSTDSVVCEGWLKWNHLSCTFLKKLPKADIAKLILKISIGNRAKWSI